MSEISNELKKEIEGADLNSMGGVIVVIEQGFTPPLLTNKAQSFINLEQGLSPEFQFGPYKE